MKGKGIQKVPREAEKCEKGTGKEEPEKITRKVEKVRFQDKILALCMKKPGKSEGGGDIIFVLNVGLH